MVKFNGVYNRHSSPGYSLHSNLINLLKAGFGVQDKSKTDKAKEISCKRIQSGVEEMINKINYKEGEENVPFTTSKKRNLPKKLQDLLNTKINGFMLVKYNSSEFLNEGNNFLRKYVGIKGRYGTLKTTSAFFSNYIYLGSPMFISLNPHECISSINKIMKNKADLSIYDLAVPRLKDKLAKVKRVSDSGLIQIRYRSFEESLKAYREFKKLVDYNIMIGII